MLLTSVRIGTQGRIVRNAILDKNVVVPDGAEIGVDHEADLARGFTVSDGGITVVGKGVKVDRADAAGHPPLPERSSRTARRASTPRSDLSKA